jgi:hypothetical protein
MTQTIEAKLAAHREFWGGRGPSLILAPASQAPQYDTENYAERFANPQRMWEAEMRRARAVCTWPTDGVPTVRPNLGVVFIPGACGQEYEIRDGQMPWVGRPLDRDEIRRLPGRDLESSGLMRLAARFYEVHHAARDWCVLAYQPDTQGIFSLAHLFYGDRIFTDAAEDPSWVHELLEITLEIHTRVVRLVKEWLGEPDHAMPHGHSFPQGVFFPNAGVRISEDTATMISPPMVKEFVLPYTERAAAAFGGCFVHYCGRHQYLFEELCRMECVRAIDLGNPELYDTRRLLRACGETGTVLFSPLAAEPNERWPEYLRRIAALARETGARLILRPVIFPESEEEASAMVELWHALTG